MSRFASLIGGIFAKYPQMGSAFIAGSVMCIPMLPDTLYLDRYVNMFSAYKDRKKVQIDKDTESLIEKVLYRVNLNPTEESQITFFSCYENDPCHKGSCMMRTGAVIGLPSTFQYKSTAEVENSDLKITSLLRSYDGYGIDWKSDEGEKLKNAISLNEQEKAFVIAREIFYTHSGHLWITMAMKGVAVCGTFYSATVLDRMFLLSQRMKLWGRIGVVTLLGGFFSCMYLFTRDAYYNWLDNSVDYSAATLTPYYANGGASYYSKILERNKTLRHMLGENVGGKYYTVYGNNNTSGLGLRTKGVPLTARRKNVENYVIGWEERKFKVREITEAAPNPIYNRQPNKKEPPKS